MDDWGARPPNSAPPGQWQPGLPPSWPHGFDPSAHANGSASYMNGGGTRWQPNQMNGQAVGYNKSMYDGPGVAGGGHGGQAGWDVSGSGLMAGRHAGAGAMEGTPTQGKTLGMTPGHTASMQPFSTQVVPRPPASYLSQPASSIQHQQMYGSSSQPLRGQYHQHLHLHQHHYSSSQPTGAGAVQSQPSRPPASWPSHPQPAVNGTTPEPMVIDASPSILQASPQAQQSAPQAPPQQGTPMTIKPTDLMLSVSTPSQQTQEDLPPAITLMHIANIHVHAARALVSSLIRRPLTASKGKARATPSDEGEVDERAKLISTYRRHIAVAVLALRAILSLSASTLNAVEPVQELAARCMLVELLFDETDGLGEAEKVLLKGLQRISEKEKSVGGASSKAGVPGDWIEWKWRLSEMQVRLALADPEGDKTKYAKNLVKRFIKETSQDPRAIAWHYHFHVLLADLALSHPTPSTTFPPPTQPTDADIASSLSVLRDAISLASSRGDLQLYIALRVKEAKLLLERAEGQRWAEIGEILGELRKMVGLTEGADERVKEGGEEKVEKVQVPQALKAQLLLLLCLYYSTVGEVKTAKEWLKQVHVIMDDTKREEGEEEGVLRIRINPAVTQLPSFCRVTAPHPPQPPSGQPGSSPVSSFGRAFSQVSLQSPTGASRSGASPMDEKEAKPPTSTGRPQAVELSTLPRGAMYTLTFLVSAVIHPDAHGKKPKATLFAAEGLRQIEDKLVGTDASAVGSDAPLGRTKLALREGRRVKIELLFLQLQLCIMRSEFVKAEETFNELTNLIKSGGQWQYYKARLMALKGTLAHATGNLDYAASCFLASLHLCRTSPSRSLSLQDELALLSKASYVLVKVAQGVRLRTKAKESGKATAKRKRGDGGEDEEKEAAVEEELEEMVKELKADAQQALPTAQTAVQIVEALTCGEIVRAKQHLSGALNNANALVNSHMKAVLLAFLASLFVNTRNEQALKMLHSSFKLATGFGSGEGEGMRAHVGHGSLGLWAGEKLYQIYASDGNVDQAHKQAKHNAAHREVLATTPTIPPLAPSDGD